MDENTGSNGQPVAQRISFDLKAKGRNEILIEAKNLGVLNVLMIEARDRGPAGCPDQGWYCKEYAWAFFDAQSPLRGTPTFDAVDEPGSALLVALALGMATAVCRRKRMGG